jgi:C4-dicarboxylate-specific signal transduction histidine kinase
MARRRGLQFDILISLLVVMITSAVVLGAGLIQAHRTHIEALRLLGARAMTEKAAASAGVAPLGPEPLVWWIAVPGAAPRPSITHHSDLEVKGRELADSARQQGASLLSSGPPWQPSYFAGPTAIPGQIAVARLPAIFPLAQALALYGAEVVVFTLFGVYLLRRRLVVPLQRLAAAARATTAGEAGVRVAVSGVAETEEVATAFNEMTEALEGRAVELEKANVELRRSNEQLRTARVGLDRAERLAAVGRLAAGVAHEVGNPMGALLAFLNIAQRDGGIAEQTREALDHASRQGGRVRSILRQLLDFSRPPQASRESVDLKAVATEVVTLVGAQSKADSIRLAVRAPNPPPLALADPGVVSQILLNLVLNAVDAVAGVAEPAVELELCAVVVDDVVECSVCDNGPGIAEEDRERIFDPFFTTKDPGEGTGLGLANAARFAEELGGRLELHAPAHSPGARFVLTLPAAPARG